MKIMPIKTKNIHAFKSTNYQKSKTNETLNDLSDGCVAIGVLCYGDKLTETQSKSKMESFAKLMLVIGTALITIRFCNKLLFKNKEEDKNDT